MTASSSPGKPPAELSSRSGMSGESRKSTSVAEVVPSSELRRAAESLLAEAAAHEATLGGERQLDALVGEALRKKMNKEDLGRKGTMAHDRSKFVADLVLEWDPNRDGTVSKMEFRSNVRKLVSGASTAESDALFAQLDADASGELDVKEVRQALTRLLSAALKAEEADTTKRQHIADLRAHASYTREVEATVAAWEEACAMLASNQKRGVGAQLGYALKKKGLKVGDLLTSWGGHDAMIDKSEFRGHVMGKLGLQASHDEVEELFDSLDSDGGGTLDLNEIEKGLKGLSDETEKKRASSERLQQKAGEMSRAAKAASEAWTQRQQERAAAQDKAAKAAEEREEAKREAAAQAAAEKRAAAQARKAEAAAEKAAFDRKIEEKRQMVKQKSGSSFSR
jgi:Ca2+-binding EF-hand superfamily protein